MRETTACCTKSDCRHRYVNPFSPGSVLGVPEVGEGYENRRVARCRVQFQDDQLIAGLAGDRPGYVQCPLRAARPVPADAEPVDPSDAFAQASCAEVQVRG